MYKLCMLIFQKVAVAQALRVCSPKISTGWRKNSTSMLAMLVASCSVEAEGASFEILSIYADIRNYNDCDDNDAEYDAKKTTGKEFIHVNMF